MNSLVTEEVVGTIWRTVTGQQAAAAAATIRRQQQKKRVLFTISQHSLSFRTRARLDTLASYRRLNCTELLGAA